MMTRIAVRSVRPSQERGSGEAMLDARGVCFGERSSRDGQDEEHEDCAVNSGKAPVPFSNCKMILGCEFSKGFGIHRDTSPKENSTNNSYNVCRQACVKYFTHSQDQCGGSGEQLAGLDEGTFTEGHELDRKWRVPQAMIGRRLSGEEAQKLLAKLG